MNSKLLKRKVALLFQYLSPFQQAAWWTGLQVEAGPRQSNIGIGADGVGQMVPIKVTKPYSIL